MRSKKTTQANLLRQEGVPALGVTILDNKTVNPVGWYNPNLEKYKLIWTNYDMNQCIMRYKWENLPNGITSWNLERMLYFRGSLCGFKVGGQVYILPYVVETGSLNPYGMPTEVRPITYNGKSLAGKEDYFNKDFKLPVDNLGNETEDYSAVILYDSIPYSPTSKSPSRFALNQIIIEDMAHTLARININIVISNKKILIVVKDAKQKAVVEKELEMIFGSDKPFGVIHSEMETDSIQNTNDFQADDLFNTLKNYDAIRCFMNGLSSKGFGSEKKERLISGELTGAEEEKELILEMGYYLRKLFCDLCNKKFGTNMSVSKVADEISEKNSTEFNGNGETAEDEAEWEV